MYINRTEFNLINECNLEFKALKNVFFTVQFDTRSLQCINTENGLFFFFLHEGGDVLKQLLIYLFFVQKLF